MIKILVTGNAGSGKRSFGKKISEHLGISLYGLDKVVWKENWVKTSKEERYVEISKIIANEKWIVEGVSKQVQRSADKVIFLDISPIKCIINIIKRFIKNGLKSREELPRNCPEYIGVYKAIKIVLIFNKVTRPWIMNDSKSDSFIRVRDYSELEDVLNRL